jgi:Protein of unknown function (DUF1488)
MPVATQLRRAWVLGREEVVRFDFDFDGRQIEGMVSRECLEDDFGMPGDAGPDDWKLLFFRHSGSIDAAAVRLMRAGAPVPVLVRAGDIRSAGG